MMRRSITMIAGLLSGVVLACSQESEVRIVRYTGDLDELRSRGTIRFLAPTVHVPHGLPRGRTPLQGERRLAELFAAARGLGVEWVWVEEYADLVPALKEGRGDVIVANYTVTPEREAEIAFSSPIVHVREVAVTHPRLSVGRRVEPRQEGPGGPGCLSPR